MNVEMVSPRVEDYLESLVPARHDEMLKMEQEAREKNFPIIGPACGHLCYQIARMIQAKQVFELGSGYGYSTVWFARAVMENGGGTVHHVVWDEELSQQAKKHILTIGCDDVVEYHVGEAVETLRSMPGQFGLIFNDIDKRGYPDSLPVVKEKLRSGGVLIIDNMLWHGRIFDDNDKARSTEGVREFIRRITEDPDWIVSLVPIRDGMIIAYKQ